MIHETLKVGHVMKRYYMITKPERQYSPGKALRQYKQDKKIDKKVLRSVIDQIYKEQKQMLK